MSAAPGASEHRFGRFVMDVARRRLLADGVGVALGARAFDLLQALIENRDRTVSRDELLEAVWPGLVVEENNLSVQVGTLRRLLGTEAITTVPGRGYRFTAAMSVARTAGAVAVPPAAPATLIGRDDDLQRLEALLDGAGAGPCLVTVVGAGGIGKTRLARELLTRRSRAHPHGGVFVDLSACGAGADLPGTVAAALDLPRVSPELASGLADAMAPLDMLLVLDNAEHLLEPVGALCAVLLRHAPGARLVVTSQAPLRTAGEQVFRLEALSVPASDATAADASRCGSVALFVARATAADRRFTLSDANVDAVIEVCRRIDGLPLALELAAARVPLLGVRGLVDALDERFRVLSAGPRSSPARQQTLRAALEWSLSLLSPLERLVFERMAVVASSASLETVQAIAADPGTERWLVVEALGGLVDRSIVQATADDPPRYRLLDSPRALARERLAAGGQWDTVSLRHARALRRCLEDGCTRIVEEGVHQGRMVDALALELPDARAALARVREQDPTTALSLTMGIGVVMSALGTLTLELPAGVADRGPQEAPFDGIPCALTAWWAFGYSDYERGDAALPGFGRAWVDRALVHAEAAGDRSAATVAQSALLGHLSADDPKAVSIAAALDALPASSPPFVRTTALSALALRHWRGGRAEHAERALERALKILEVQGAAATARVARSSLIAFWLSRGRGDRALEMGRALQAELVGTRNERGLAACRRMVTTALLFDGEHAQARATCTEGWDATRITEERTHPGWLDLLALLAAQEGRSVTACLLIGRSDAAWQVAGRVRGRTSALVRARAMVRADSALGPDEACRRIAQGRRLTAPAVEELALSERDATDPL